MFVVRIRVPWLPLPRHKTRRCLGPSGGASRGTAEACEYDEDEIGGDLPAKAEGLDPIAVVEDAEVQDGGGRGGYWFRGLSPASRSAVNRTETGGNR